MNYPRYKNGHKDDGRPVASSSKRCPNCGSTSYRETISKEECTACGLKCDYWGSGANEVYEDMMDRRYAREERERELEDERWREENGW